MQSLCIGLFVALMLTLAGLGVAYSKKRGAMRNQAAMYAGDPPGSGNDVYDETILDGIQAELERLVKGARELHTLSAQYLQKADAGFLLDMRELYAYLAAQLGEKSRRSHGGDIEELCTRVVRLGNSAGTNVYFMHATNVWVNDVRRWQEVVWWLAPALRIIAEVRAIEA